MILKWTNQIKVALSSGGVEYRSIHLSNYITQRTLCFSQKMKFFEKVSLNKLCAALQGKDWKAVERQQNKLGLEQFLAVEGLVPENLFCYRITLYMNRKYLLIKSVEIYVEKQTVLFRATKLVSLKNNLKIKTNTISTS